MSTEPTVTQADRDKAFELLRIWVNAQNHRTEKAEVVAQNLAQYREAAEAPLRAAALSNSMVISDLSTRLSATEKKLLVAKAAADKAECQLNKLVEELANLFGWSDRTFVHAILHVSNAVLNLQADLQTLKNGYNLASEQREHLPRILANLFGWSDESFIHAMLHVENAVREIQARAAVAEAQVARAELENKQLRQGLRELGQERLEESKRADSLAAQVSQLTANLVHADNKIYELQDYVKGVMDRDKAAGPRSAIALMPDTVTAWTGAEL